MNDAEVTADLSWPPAATLLIATSDSATRALLRKALHVRAVDVVEASDGVEALALARRLELDLVLLDAFLAVLDGISVCARIRALPEINQPAIAIMGLSSSERWSWPSRRAPTRS